MIERSIVLFIYLTTIFAYLMKVLTPLHCFLALLLALDNL